MRTLTHLFCILFISSVVCACIDTGLLDFSSRSDIYLSNNTDQTLTIQVTGYGNVDRKKDQDWWQFSDTIAPYQTLKLLSVERKNGFESGNAFTLEAEISNQAGETLTLQQQLKGKKNSSDMSYTAFDADTPASLRDNKSINRLSSSFNQTASSNTDIAFQAKAKARFEDVHYAITATRIAPEFNENPDQLKLLSYNVWALPLIASDIPERLALIPQHVQGYDVLLIQEAFSDHRQDFFLQLAQQYPYQTRMLDKDGFNVHDGGVIIFSRFPIVREAQSIFADCADADCLADKGINYASIIKHGRAYHVFATHTTSFDTATAHRYRQKQFQQMRDFAAALEIPTTETVIYGGDMNVNKRLYPEKYQNMLDTLNSHEPVYAGYTEATFDPRINVHAEDPLAGGKVEYLDYILVSNQYKSVTTNRNTVRVTRSSAENLWRLWDLSDHFPVEAFIE